MEAVIKRFTEVKMELPKMVWMEVDIENKELPIHIADTAEELAKMCGTTENNVRSSASRGKRGQRRRFVKVWIGD